MITKWESGYILKIYIGADFVPTDINRILFENGDMHSIIGTQLYSMLCEADLNVFNLEAPLTDNDTSIDKFGHNLKSPTKTINGFKAIPSLLLGLANNHSYDQGYEGLQSTMQVLTQSNIAYSGAGGNVNEAKQPYIFTKDGIRLGIYMCTENEFSSASVHRAGANPFDVLESFDHVQTLKEQCDYVIVIYHGGKEFYRYPSPMLQRYCRKFIEKGASLVLCQHSHCIGAREDYETGTIIYGQGSFVFQTEYFNNLHDIVADSLVVEINIDQDGVLINEIPVTRTEVGITLATKEHAQLVIEMYNQLREDIKNPHFVYESYKCFADEHINRYLREFLGRSWVVKALNLLCNRKLARLLLGKTSYLAIQNYLTCEAHHELFLQGLKNINHK